MGYQAKGTPGAVIQACEGAEGFVQVDLDGRMYDIRAKVLTLAGYSAHADQVGLITFATGMSQVPKSIVLVHGERGAKAELANALKRRFEGLQWTTQIRVPV